MAPAPSSTSQGHANTDEDDTTTYTKMATGDVDAIGAHCQAAFCRQLDFLPFRCESCKGTFCGEHRTETAHACSNAGAWARSRRPREVASSGAGTTLGSSAPPAPCAHPQCKTIINTGLVPGVDCTTCARSYCLKHRLPEDHDCKNLPKPQSRLATQGGAGGVAETMGRLRAWRDKMKTTNKSSGSSSATKIETTAPQSKQSERDSKLHRIVSPFTLARQSKSNSATARLTALNNLKKSATGDAKIPAEKRVYVHLEAVAEGEGHAGAKIPRADAFYSMDWSIGKVLDAAAKTLAVTNVNNRGGGEAEKLRVFWVDGGRLLDFPEKLSATKVSSGDTLVLLRGVGAPNT